MNRTQQWIVGVGLATFIVATLFPPWLGVRYKWPPYQGKPDPYGPYDQGPLGYSFLLWPPVSEECYDSPQPDNAPGRAVWTLTARIDGPRLAWEWGAIALVTAMLFLGARFLVISISAAPGTGRSGPPTASACASSAPPSTGGPAESTPMGRTNSGDNPHGFRPAS
jgi:hypothetical protein